ncbi:MAG: rRNA maturation RNase YbeY [Candidatus Paceibacterota bacterium]|jgi:rRNA maturation RNase YbeY
MSTDKLGVKNLTKGKLPRLPFSLAKEMILGKNYELSLVFIGNQLARKLNKIYRNKNDAANVLSFSLDKHTGEIFINLEKVKTDARVALLLIHALLHLKGLQHSSKMEGEERKFLSLISNYVPPNLNRYRYRQSSNKSNGHRNGGRLDFAAHHRRRLS